MRCIKKPLVPFFTVMFFSLVVADEIYLKDGTVVSGRILAVTASQVEYDPADSIPFDVVLREAVQKIVYANGRSVSFAAPTTNTAPAESPAQTNFSEKAKESSVPSKTSSSLLVPFTPPPSKVFLEGELGWNGGCGLGAKVDGQINKNMTLNLGMGLSGWGFRVSGGSRYYFNYPSGSSFGLLLSNSLGLGEFRTLLEYQDTNGNTVEDSVSIKFKPAFALHAFYRYDLLLGRSFKLFGEFGYALPLQKEPYEVEPGKTLTSKSKSFMKFMDPGGIMLVLGLGLRP